jgi:hypothetical protein
VSTLDALFAEVNRYPLTVKAPTKIAGRSLRGKNELPLISQSIANSIATVAWAIASPRGQGNIQKTIETSVNRKFLPYMNSMSRANKKSMHHLYEWNKVGSTRHRLFDLVIPPTSRGRANFSMGIRFRPSRTLVPLTEAQANPGPTGKVVKKVHVFWNKAMVMEYGQKVIVRPKSSRFLAFDTPPGLPTTPSGLTFTSHPVYIDYSSRPTYHGLQNAIEGFFSGYGQREIKNGMDGYGRSVRRGAGRASHMISVSVPSDAYAHAVASRMANAMVPHG